MRVLLVVFFSILLQSSPSLENHQSPTDKESSQHKRSDTAQHQPEKTQIAETKATTNEKPESATNSTNGEQTYKVEIKEGKPDWWARIGILINGALAVAAFITLLLIKHQRDVMKGQLIEMKGAGTQTRELIQQSKEQVDAMREQVEQMQSASLQTNHLIGHAARQADALYSVASEIRQSLRFSEVTSSAALMNALAIIKGQRAQIVCKWRKIGESLFNLCIENCGKTPAPIVDVDIRTTTPPITESLPDVPTYLDQRVLQARILCAEEKWCDAVGFTLEMSTNGFPRLWDAIAHQKIRCWIWGRIRYKDIFNTEEIHETRFCFFYESRINSFVVGGPAEYTKYT